MTTYRSKFSKLKSDLGSKCTFVAPVVSSKGNYIDVFIKNEIGSRDKLRFKINGNFEDVLDVDFKEIKKIIEKKYQHTND